MRCKYLGVLVFPLISAAGCTSYLPSNKPPIAFAGYDQKAAVTIPVSLDGNESFDPDGDTLHYLWSVQSAPDGANFELKDITKPIASFTAETSGLYVISLVVSDGSADSKPDLVNVTILPGGIVNKPPIADAGDDHDVKTGSKALLDGTGSTDPDGDKLIYRWTFSAVPAGSVLVDSDIQPNKSESASTAFFTPDKDGDYVVILEVDDQHGNKDTDTVTVTASENANTPPVADAGYPFTVTVGSKAMLDATGSYDPDGDRLTYAWSFAEKPEGSGLADSSITARFRERASFIPDVEGEYILVVIVDDGTDTDEDQVTVTAVPQGMNHAPVADAGDNVQVDKNTEAVLDGTGSSDPDGDALVYNWIIESKPEGSLAMNDWITPNNSTEASRPSFTPDRGGLYRVRLMVDDGNGGTDTDSLWVRANNEPPTVEAGGPYSVLNRHEVTLSGSASDPEGDPVTYSWSFQTLPEGSGLTDDDIGDRDQLTASFTPDKKGTYVLALTVTDWDQGETTDTAEVESQNNPPDAKATGPSAGAPGVPVTVSGANSTDLDGDDLSFSWSFTDLPQGSSLGDRDITGRTNPEASFTPDAEGTYTLQLTVTDTDNASGTDTISIEVTRGLVITTSSSELPQGRECRDYSFDRIQASGGTPPYTFTQIGNGLPPDLVLTGDGVINGTLQQGTAGNHPFVVQVIDQEGATAQRQLVLTVIANQAPIARAGNDVSGPNLSELLLDGSSSNDPDGDDISFSWSFVSLPAGSGLTDTDINNNTSASCSFTPDKKGDYILQLTVSDTCGGSSTDQVTATALNNPPEAFAVFMPLSPTEGERVDLDGTGSTDPDGDTLSYSWSFVQVPQDSSLTNSDITGANAVQAWFEPDAGGTFTVRLTVNDGDGGTDQADIDIIVTALPQLRITTNSSDIPDARECIPYTPYALQAENGQPPYSWSEDGNVLQPVGLTIDSNGDIRGTPRKATAGTVTFTARVTDQNSDTATKDLDITILANRQPLADAGQDTSVPNLSEISLSGSASDPDSNPLAYIWRFVTKPAGSGLNNGDISGRDTLNPSFIPDVKGTFILELEVRDGCDGSATDQVAVTSLNNPPVADAGPDQTVPATGTLTPVQLDGTGSHDIDGDSLAYSWSLEGVRFSQAPAPSIRLPEGTWNIDLTVDDGDGGTDQDTVTIEVTAEGRQVAAYVSINDPSSNDSNPCTKDQPCSSVTRGLDRAVELTGINGFLTGAIVAEGDYHETISIRSQASLYCGFDPNTWVRDPENNQVHLYSSQNNGVTTELGTTRDVEVMGCFFHGHNAGDGDRTVNTLRIDNASPTLIGNAIILGEAAYLRGLYIVGNSSKPLVAWNTIIGGRVRDRRGSSNENGQAVLIVNGAIPVLAHNYIVGPSCDNGGGFRWNVHCEGILIDGVTASLGIDRITIDSNYIVGGDTCGMPCTGLALNGSFAVVTNNIVHGGFSDETCGLGFFLPEDNENINPIVYHNVLLGGEAGSLSISVCLFPERDDNNANALGRLELVSNILAYADYGVYEYGPRLEPAKCWNNDFDEDTLDTLYSDAIGYEKRDRDLEWINEHFSEPNRPARNISGNPDFVDPDNSNPTDGDWHIGPDSACIDMGAMETVDSNPGIMDVTKDFEGEDRPSGNAPDIGADER